MDWNGIDKLICIPLLLAWNGTLAGKNLLPNGSKFFPDRVPSQVHGVKWGILSQPVYSFPFYSHSMPFHFFGVFSVTSNGAAVGSNELETSGL